MCVSIKTARSDDVMNGDILYQCENKPIRVENDLIDNISSCTFGSTLKLNKNQITTSVEIALFIAYPIVMPSY